MGETTTAQLQVEEEDTQKGKYLTFLIGSETFGIEIRYVTEIIGIQPITEMPELPKYVKGIINLRGKIIPVMDIRLRFKKQFKQYDGKTCVIVIDIENLSIGLIVDSVSEVLSIPDEEIVPPPELSGNSSKYIKGIGKADNEVKLLLDCNKLLSEEEIDNITKI
ncbi:MAG: chemotaxis protein CheW [Bacillota bacterium]|nr:chemotaxis protein CheW [Bacillota bacterium]